MKSEVISGVRIFIPSSREELIDFAFQEKKILVAVNGEKIQHATEQTSAIINRNAGYADGIGAVWALKRKGHTEAIKIAGCELWLNIIDRYHQTKSFYLIGGKEDVIQGTHTKLSKEYPSMNIVGYRNGYLKDELAVEKLMEDIEIKKPDVVFVAMGSPKQELLMERIYKKHPAVYQGLGGSFDLYVGNTKRAPKWWLKNNLEGVYRALAQPKGRIMRDLHLIPYFYKLVTNQL